MINKVEITYIEENKDKDKLKIISEILSEGVYEYLKEKDYLRKSSKQKIKIKRLIDKVKALRK